MTISRRGFGSTYPALKRWATERWATERWATERWATERWATKRWATKRWATLRHACDTGGWQAVCGIVLLAVFPCLPAWGQASPDPRVREIAKTVDQHYNSLRSLQAEFTESYRGMGVARTESGTLWLKRPGRMRWEYREPQEKLFVTDDKTAWFYLPEERQVRRAPVKKLDDLRSPLRYLLGKSRLEKEFDGLALAEGVTPTAAGNVVLRGLPRILQDRVREVLLEVTADGRIVRIVVEELDDSTTEFHFRNLVENSAVSDERFRFTPPEGAEVIEAEEFGK